MRAVLGFVIRRLAALGVLMTCRLAVATPPCPAALEEVASLAGPSRWQAIAAVPGSVTSLAGSGDTIIAAAIVDGTPKLLELVNDGWQDVPDAPAATGVAVIGGFVYAFSKRDGRAVVSFARRGTTAWSPTTAPPEVATIPFACGDALCASISINVPTLPDEVHTYAATPSSTGALGSWTHVLSGGREVLIGTSTVADSTGFILAREGTYANPIDPGGRYRAVWHRVGPPTPGAGPAAIAHDGWLLVAGGIVRDSVPAYSCNPRPRNTSSNLVYAARIAADGSVGRWRAAAPLPRGGVVRLVASAQQVYALTTPTPRRAPVDLVAIPWTELVASIEPGELGKPGEPTAPGEPGSDPPAPPRRIPEAPAHRPYKIDIPDAWIEVPAEPIAQDAAFALEYRTKTDPRTTLHVSWIHFHSDHEDRPTGALSRALGRAEIGFIDNTGMRSRGPNSWKPEISTVIDTVWSRAPHAIHLRMVGVADSSAHVWIALAACTGIESELAACEKVLATLNRVESEPSSRLMWMLGITLVVVAMIAMMIWIKRR
jgi:hypothetical protein